MARLKSTCGDPVVGIENIGCPSLDAGEDITNVFSKTIKTLSLLAGPVEHGLVARSPQDDSDNLLDDLVEDVGTVVTDLANLPDALTNVGVVANFLESTSETDVIDNIATVVTDLANLPDPLTEITEESPESTDTAIAIIVERPISTDLFDLSVTNTGLDADATGSNDLADEIENLIEDIPSIVAEAVSSFDISSFLTSVTGTAIYI